MKPPAPTTKNSGATFGDSLNSVSVSGSHDTVQKSTLRSEGSPFGLPKSEDRVHLSDRLMDGPAAFPSDREHRDVPGLHLGGLTAVGRHRHPARQHVDDLVLLLDPIRRSRGALTDACRPVAVYPHL